MTASTQTPHYDYSPIVDRPKLQLPDGKRIAVIVNINMEHFPVHAPGTPIVPQTAGMKPDPLNYGWRDYGQRVGIWRMIDILDEVGAKASVCLNSDVCDEYPQIIKAGLERGWSWMSHGRNNTELLNGMSPEEEEAVIRETTDKIEKATGQRPKGWLGPFLAASFETPNILARNGYEYFLDYSCDDQPFPMNVSEGSLLSVPYSVECNDLPAVLSFGVTAEGFGQLIKDQFDVLYQEGAETARVMPICLHTFIVGQPFRAKYLREALQYIAGHDDVWFATCDEINDWYRSVQSA